MRNRASRRTLVRWNDDHDKELLLWMNYCCTEQGIKVPWARIAQCMGASFTEGACIQHLAKIRTKMEEAGLHVPPVQKRGTITKTGSSIYRPKLKEITAPVPRVRPDIPPQSSSSYFLDDSDEEEEEEEDEGPTGPTMIRVSRVARGSVRRQAGRPKPSVVKEDSDIDEDEPELYDSDNEYGAKKASLSPNKTAAGSQKSPKIHMRLNIGGKQPASQAGGDQIDMDHHNDHPGAGTMRWGQSSPAIKFETIADRQDANAPKPMSFLPHGLRRKSSTMTGDEDEVDDYAPSSRAKGKNKKPRMNRTYTSKPQANDKDEMVVNFGPAQMPTYQTVR